MFDCTDRKGWPLGPDFFVRVEKASGDRWKGWVLSYDAEQDLLMIRDSKKCFERYAKPADTTFVRPSVMDKARKIGQDKSIKYASETLRRRKLI